MEHDESAAFEDDDLRHRDDAPEPAHDDVDEQVWRWATDARDAFPW